MVDKEQNVKLKVNIEKVLKSDERLWNSDKTEMNQTLLWDLVEKIDEIVIGLLLQEKTIRERFFVKIKDAYVFKTNDFRFFMEENKIENSYTAYKNRIGLTDGKRFLKDTNDIVLDFPYKDCILEGGQSTEEGLDTYFEYDEKVTATQEKQGLKSKTYNQKTAKRKEIFFNQILAHDEIDRLFDPKALVNWKRFTPEGEQEVKEIKRDEEETIKENLIIKGNNLLALHSIKKQFAGKVKLIYIDPPYNTETDSFVYNDKFTHSTWLTFIKNRLLIAKDLLKNDGVIFIQCDNKEQSYLKVLCDEIFGRENFRNNIIWRKLLSAKKQSKYLSNVTEHILIYSKSNTFILNKLFLEAEETKDLKNYPYIEEITERRYGSFDFTQKGKGPARIFNGKKMTPPKGKHWIWDQNRIDEGLKCNLIIFTKNGTPRVKRYLDEKEGNPISDLWIDDEVKIISANDKERLEFDGQKPEFLIKRIIALTTYDNDLIMDFFAGTCTTCAVAHKMNRQYIGIEQLDYVNTLSIPRLKKVIGHRTKKEGKMFGKIEYDISGISKSVNWLGGGNFIYFELAKWNEIAREQILRCKSFDDLFPFFDEMYEKYFLNYNLKIKEFKEKVLQDENFKGLSLDEQKKMFVTILDNNQLYINKSEMDDKKFGLTKEDKELTTQFYGSEK